MLRFVHEQNLTRYIEMLQAEPDGAKREQLQTLLIEEENRFGSLREKLDEMEMLIAKGRARVRQQQRIVDQLARDGAEAGPAERLLANMSQMIDLFQACRTTLMGETEIETGCHLSEEGRE